MEGGLSGVRGPFPSAFSTFGLLNHVGPPPLVSFPFARSNFLIPLLDFGEPLDGVLSPFPRTFLVFELFLPNCFFRRVLSKCGPFSALFPDFPGLSLRFF